MPKSRCIGLDEGPKKPVATKHATLSDIGQHTRAGLELIQDTTEPPGPPSAAMSFAVSTAPKSNMVAVPIYGDDGLPIPLDPTAFDCDAAAMKNINANGRKGGAVASDEDSTYVAPASEQILDENINRRDDEESWPIGRGDMEDSHVGVPDSDQFDAEEGGNDVVTGSTHSNNPTFLDATVMLAYQLGLHVVKAYIVDEVGHGVFMATPVQPWWKQGITKILLCAIFAMAAISSVTNSLLLSSEEIVVVVASTESPLDPSQVSLTFEDDVLNACPQGWSCTNEASVQPFEQDLENPDHEDLDNVEGDHFFDLGTDGETGTGTSYAFLLPAGTTKIKFKRAGGAIDGGLRVYRASDDKEICEKIDGTNSDVMFENERYVNGYDGENIYIYVWDCQISGWGKTFIDDIRFADASDKLTYIGSSISGVKLFNHTKKDCLNRRYCGCNTCTQTVWNLEATNADGSYSCGSRITWLRDELDFSEDEACAKVASEFSGTCLCDPAQCHIDHKYCGCESCNQAVWLSSTVNDNGSHSCGSRISWLRDELGYSEDEACTAVGSEFPNICPCDPSSCQIDHKYCGCESCNQAVWLSTSINDNGSHSCGSRISWLRDELGYSQDEACTEVGSEFPSICLCDPTSC